MVADIISKQDGDYFVIRNALGKTEHVHVDEFEDTWHPAHPDDEVPPRKARSKSRHIAEFKKNK